MSADRIMPYGINTPLVIGFLSLLASLPEERRADIVFRDPARLARFSDRWSLWRPAYDAVIDGLRRTGRMTATGDAWVEVHRILGVSPLALTARPVVDALIAWDLVTPEQRLALWSAFASVAPLPGTERGAA